MSKKNTTGTGLDYIENPEALAGQIVKVESAFYKNRKLLLIVGGVVLAAVVLFGAYRFYIDGQERIAQNALANAIYDYEADSLQKALKGSGGNEGLLSISEGYKGTDASNIASFLAGAALLKDGKFDEAITQLKSFSSSDYLVQARAYSLIGDAYMEKNQASEAISYYSKAAGYKSNSFFSPNYMIKLGIAYEKNNQPEQAIKTYKDIIEKFPLSGEAVVKAKKFLGVLQGQSGE